MELDSIEQFYADALEQHGQSAEGVGWGSEDAQVTYWTELMEVVGPAWQHAGSFSINDYGCGYGALAPWLAKYYSSFEYRGYDLVPAMADAAKEQVADDPRCTIVDKEEDLTPADYTITSGMFNWRGEIDEGQWEEYVFSTIDRLAELSTVGFAYNVLSSYADRREPGLYNADPKVHFDRMMKKYPRCVDLLHSSGRHSFAVIVRKL